MIDEPEVALVFSSEPWFEDLHRHLTDHGGARVRQVVMDPALALGDQYDTLVVSHRWPALTRRFVDEVHARARSILGVYDPAEPAGRDHLVALGVDDVIANDVPVSAFVEPLTALAPNTRREPQDSSCDDAVDADASVAGIGSGVDQGRLVAIGGTPGAGRSEVAIALGDALGARGGRVLLVDSDEIGPSLGQRLGLPIEPNVRSAIESVEHAVGEPARCVHPVTSRLDVLCGLPNVALWSQIRPGEVLDVIRVLGATYRHVIADVASTVEELDGSARGRYGMTRAIVAEATSLVGVGIATPVGVSRLLGWVAAVRLVNSDAAIHLLVNRSSGKPFLEAEIDHEVRRTFEPASLSFLPDDRKLDAAVWAAQLVRRGPFVRRMRRSVVEAVAGRGSQRRSGRPEPRVEALAAERS